MIGTKTKNVREIFNKSYGDITLDDVLEAFGVRRAASTSSYALPALGFFGVGMLVGVGLGMIFAPKSGHELRDDIKHRASDIGRKVGVGGEKGYEGYEKGRRFEGRGYETTGQGYESAGIGTSGVIGSTYEGKGPYPGSSSQGGGNVGGA